MSNTINVDHAAQWRLQNTTTTQASNVNSASGADESVFTSNQNAVKPVQAGSVLSDKCDDGSDDGKLSVGSAICAFGKGILKSAFNTVKDILTDPKKLLITAATATVCVLFPPAAVALGAVGVATGVYGIGKSAVKAYQLYNDPNATDAEAKAAFQDMGGSALQTALSVFGMKGGLKAMKATKGSAMAELASKGKSTGVKGFGETVKAYAKDTASGGRGFQEGTFKINTSNAGYKGTQMYTNVKANINNAEGAGLAKVARGLGKSASDGYQNIKTTRVQRAAQKEYNKYETMDDAKKAEFTDNMNKNITEAQSKVADAQAKVNDLTKQLADATDDVKPGIQKQLDAAKGELKTAQTGQAQIEAQNQAFENAKTATQQAKADYNKALDGAKDAMDDLNNAQKAYKDALKGGDKVAIETAKAELTSKTAAFDDANNVFKNAKTDYNLTSSNPITYNAQKFSNFAKDGGYSSGFGALTAPIANQNYKYNAQNSNSDRAAQEKYLNNIATNNQNGGYGFSGDYTDLTLNRTGNYEYNVDYNDIYAKTNNVFA